MKLKQFTIAIALIGPMSLGTAFAGGDGGYYAPTGQAERTQKREGPGMMDRFNDWLSGFGAIGQGLASAFSNPYVVARAGFTVYDNAEYSGGSVTNGYNAVGTGDNAPFDIRAITKSGAGDADLGGNFTVGFGVDYDVGVEYGGIRSEFEFGYNQYSADYCFTGIPATNPNAPGTALGRRQFGEVENNVFTPEGVLGPQYPGIAGTRAEAQGYFEDRLAKTCASYEEPTYHFVLHNYWDLKLGGIVALGDMDLGLFNELEINLGVGVGYMVVDDKSSKRILLYDAHEPRYGRFEENVGPTRKAADKVIDDPGFAPSRYDDERAGTGLIQYVQRTGDGSRVPNANEADTDREHTVGRTPELESGLYVPISAGFTYDFAKMLNVPVRAEVIYRYNAVAPKGMRKAHGVLFGVRYAF